MKIKAYKKDFDYTYTLGVFETIELLKNRPDLVLRVYIKVILIRIKVFLSLMEFVEKNILN